VGFFRRPRFTPVGAGAYMLHLSRDERALLATLPDQLEALLAGAGGETAVARLFPPAYAADRELDAEYQRLMHEELVRRRMDALAVVRDTIDAPRLTGEQLDAWVRVLNDVRLVLGTLLDVSEDTDVLDADLEGDDAAQRVAYVVLSSIVDDAVEALAGALPPPSQD
jgi:uncharacterized protein DUF2017